MINPLPPLPCLWERLENGSSPRPAHTLRRPQPEAISGVDRPFRMGEERGLGRQLDSMEEVLS